MSYNIDFIVASSKQIEAALYRRLVKIRLSRNITQPQLAEMAGISSRTVRRMEKGESVSLNTFIRVLTALGFQDNLRDLLPDPEFKPLNMLKHNNESRKRARTKKTEPLNNRWTWGDGENE